VFLQAFLNLWTKDTTVTGLDYLMDALKEENREARGVMTGKSSLLSNPQIIDVHQYRIISLCELNKLYIRRHLSDDPRTEWMTH
jgi:hypothetical protein